MDEFKSVYENAFTGVGPSANVRDRILSMGREEPLSPLRFVRRLSTAAAAVLVLLALLGCGAAAVVYGEGIQGFFARQWERLTGAPMGESQTALLDHLSQDLSLSQTVDGVTVTLDSATIGSDMFYLLVRVEDAGLAGGGSCGFEFFDVTLSPDPLLGAEELGGYGWSSQGTDQEGRPLLLVEQSYQVREGLETDASPLEVTLTLTNLCRGAGSDQVILAEGTWTFHFTLDRSQIPPPVSLPDTQVVVTDYFSGERYAGLFTNIEVTSTGLCYDQTFEHDDFPDFIPLLILNDGTEISGGDGYGTRVGEDTFRCVRRWSVPVDLSQAAAVRFGDTDIPLP